jgi:hypothetical protein
MSREISPEMFYRLSLTSQIKMTAVGKLDGAGFWAGPVETFKDIQFVSYESWELPARQAMWGMFLNG